MKDETRAAILAEIVDLVKSRSGLRDDEFTTEEFARAMGVEQLEAYRMLKREISRGILEKRKLTIDGHLCCVYRKVVTN